MKGKLYFIVKNFGTDVRLNCVKLLLLTVFYVPKQKFTMVRFMFGGLGMVVMNTEIKTKMCLEV